MNNSRVLLILKEFMPIVNFSRAYYVGYPYNIETNVFLNKIPNGWPKLR